MFVKDCMTKNPITVTPDTSIYEAASLMRRNRFHRLPVVEDGHLIGIILDRDILKVSPSPATSLSKYEITELLDKMTVRDVMKTDVPTIRQDSTLDEAALIMYRNNVNTIPVMSSVGAVVGIITERDLFKSIIDVIGLDSGKVRITIEVQNRVGVIRDIAGAIADAGHNIDSLATIPRENGMYDIDVRIDIDDEESVCRALEAKGFSVKYTAKIG